MSSKSTKPRWSRKLNKGDLAHLAEGSSTGRPSLRSLKENLASQAKYGIECHHCTSIAHKVADAMRGK